jgi:hypothetical protein
MTRRQLILSAGLAALQGVDPSLAQPPGVGSKPDYSRPLPDERTLGTNPATKAEAQIADIICSRAPKRPTPYDVSNFFIDVGLGKYGNDWKPVWSKKLDASEKHETLSSWF